MQGEGGTGKSHLIRALVQHFSQRGARVILCGSTGKAASLLGMGATTAHRAAGLNTGRFHPSSDPSLNLWLDLADVFIMDEASCSLRCTCCNPPVCTPANLHKLQTTLLLRRLAWQTCFC